MEKIKLEKALEKVGPGWAAAAYREAICKTFRFPDFAQAFAFMTKVAAEAERVDHHPEWSNVYSRVDVTLTTHDADGVTERDILMANFMDHAADEAAAD